MIEISQIVARDIAMLTYELKALVPIKEMMSHYVFN